MGLVEPINSRITDPRYFLNTPHQGTAHSSPKDFHTGEETALGCLTGQIPGCCLSTEAGG